MSFSDHLKPQFIVQLNDGETSPDIYEPFAENGEPEILKDFEVYENDVTLEAHEQLGVSSTSLSIYDKDGAEYIGVIYKIRENKKMAYIKAEDYRKKFFQIEEPESLPKFPEDSKWHIKWLVETDLYRIYKSKHQKLSADTYQIAFINYTDSIPKPPKMPGTPNKYDSLDSYNNSASADSTAYAFSNRYTASYTESIADTIDDTWLSKNNFVLPPLSPVSTIDPETDQRIATLATTRDSAKQNQLILYPFLILSTIAVIIVIGELVFNYLWSMLDESPSDSISIIKEKHQDYKNPFEAQHDLLCFQLNKFAKCHQINRKQNITAKTLQAYLVDQAYWIQHSLVLAVTSDDTSEVTKTLNFISSPQCVSRTTTIQLPPSSFTITVQPLTFTPSCKLPAFNHASLTVSSTAITEFPVAFSVEYASSRSRSRPIFIPYSEEYDSSAQSAAEKTTSFGSSMYALLLNLKRFRKADELTKKQQPKQLSHTSEKN